LLSAASVVLLFGSTLAIVILQFSPVPILDVMGGIHLTPREAVLSNATFAVGCWSAPTWLLSLLGVAATAVAGKWRGTKVLDQSGQVARSLWYVAAAALLGWGFILPFTQREQQLRYVVEDALTGDRIAEGIAIMSRHRRDDFPPHWDPPPWLAMRDARPPLTQALKIVLDRNSSDWVRAIYVEKLNNLIKGGWHSYSRLSYGQDSDGRDRLLALLERLPEGPSIVDQNLDAFQWMWAMESDPGRKDRLRRLLESSGHQAKDPRAPSVENDEPVKTDSP
jgi:hypothetical protein